MNQYIKNLKILPRWIIILIDSGLFLFSVIIGYLLRFNFNLNLIEQNNYELGVILFVGAGLLSTFLTRSYSGIIRYTGFQDSIRVSATVTLAALIITGVNLIGFNTTQRFLIPFSVLLIAYMASLLFLVNYRILVKVVFSYYRNSGKRKNVMIIGAGKIGQITRQIIESENNYYKVVCFVDEDSRKQGKVLNGIKIYPERDLKVIFKKYKVDEAIIAIQDLAVDRKNEIVDECISNGIRVKNTPPVSNWVKGSLSTKQIKDIRIEDLLGRESISLNNYYVDREIAGKKILITGAAGSIGSELSRQVLQHNPQLVILVDQSESPLFDIENELRGYGTDVVISCVISDITAFDRIKVLFQNYSPDIVLHSAAYKHVPLMESNPAEAILCNVQGTKNLADLSVKYGVSKFVMVSTDKAVNPTNVMGASKRIAEMYVQALNHVEIDSNKNKTRFITTRFGNVLGSNGSVIPLFKEQIERGGPVTVTHPEITRFFMTIPEACQLVLEASAMGKGGEVFVFDMGESVKISDMATKMIALSGLELGKDIEIVFTGLRDGEKLFEELLTGNENNIPTHHSKIMIAKVEEVPYFKISREVESLIESSLDKEENAIVGEMKKIVPEFVSNSSRFEKLDKKSS